VAAFAVVGRWCLQIGRRSTSGNRMRFEASELPRLAHAASQRVERIGMSEEVMSTPCPIATLSTNELCTVIEGLADAERRTEWLLCRHLAVLADRFQHSDPALAAYADVYQLARLCFGMRCGVSASACASAERCEDCHGSSRHSSTDRLATRRCARLRAWRRRRAIRNGWQPPASFRSGCSSGASRK